MLKTSKCVFYWKRFSFPFPTWSDRLSKMLVTQQTPRPSDGKEDEKIEIVCEGEHLIAMQYWFGVVWCGVVWITVVWSDLLWWLLYCSWCWVWGGGGGCHISSPWPGPLTVCWWRLVRLDWTGCEAREVERRTGRQCWLHLTPQPASQYTNIIIQTVLSWLMSLSPDRRGSVLTTPDSSRSPPFVQRKRSEGGPNKKYHSLHSENNFL